MTVEDLERAVGEVSSWSYDERGNRRVPVRVKGTDLTVVVDASENDRDGLAEVIEMALYTYDSVADALYVLLVDEDAASIAETVELSPTLHVDLDASRSVIGVEVLYPRSGEIELAPLRDRFGIELEIPFSFAA